MRDLATRYGRMPALLVAAACLMAPMAGAQTSKDTPLEAKALEAMKKATKYMDETDTSCFRDESDQRYISTSAFIRNMTVLTDDVKAAKGSRR